MTTAAVLGIFAKWPQAGAVKTRLARATSPDFAAQVADAFLCDTLDRFAAVAAERWLVFSPDDAAAALHTLVDGRFRLTPQGPGDLGARLQRFFEDRLAAGGERVVVIGTDSPTLPTDVVELAFRELTGADIVLGPATDGGYYLIGCSRRLPPIFTGIAWGTATVLRDTIAWLDESWRLALLPPWYDVDTLDDWRLLHGHIAALRRAGIDPGLPHTEAVLRECTS